MTLRKRLVLYFARTVRSARDGRRLSNIVDLDDRVGCSLGETALILTTNHADISLLAPRIAPGVLDDPEVELGCGIITITNDEDTVVEVLTARALEDTALVSLEDGLVGLDGDGDRLHGGGLVE